MNDIFLRQQKLSGTRNFSSKNEKREQVGGCQWPAFAKIFLNLQKGCYTNITSDDGEITVNVASGDYVGLTAAICTALAEKLMGDGQFQEELMLMIEIDEKGDDK